MNIKTFFINITALTPSEQYQTTKAKRTYLKTHGECAVCGNRKCLEVHHRIPVHIDPSLACDPKNFIVLCDIRNQSCHRWFGHFGNFSSKWNTKIREYAIFTRLFIEREDPSRKFLISTNDMISEFAKALNITTDELLSRVKSLNA